MVVVRSYQILLPNFWPFSHWSRKKVPSWEGNVLERKQKQFWNLWTNCDILGACTFANFEFHQNKNPPTPSILFRNFHLCSLCWTCLVTCNKGVPLLHLFLHPPLLPFRNFWSPWSVMIIVKGYLWSLVTPSERTAGGNQLNWSDHMPLINLLGRGALEEEDWWRLMVFELAQVALIL